MIEIRTNWRIIYLEPVAFLFVIVVFLGCLISSPGVPVDRQEWTTLAIVVAATIAFAVVSSKYIGRLLVPKSILLDPANASVRVKRISGSQRLSSCNDLLAIQQTAATKFRPGLFVLNFTTGRNIYLLDDGSNELVQFLTELSRYSKVSISELDHYDSTKTRPQSSAESTLYTISVY